MSMTVRCNECGKEFTVEFDIHEALVDHIQVFHGVPADEINDVRVIEPGESS